MKKTDYVLAVSLALFGCSSAEQTPGVPRARHERTENKRVALEFMADGAGPFRAVLEETSGVGVITLTAYPEPLVSDAHTDLGVGTAHMRKLCREIEQIVAIAAEPQSLPLVAASVRDIVRTEAALSLRFELLPTKQSVVNAATEAARKEGSLVKTFDVRDVMELRSARFIVEITADAVSRYLGPEGSVQALTKAFERNFADVKTTGILNSSPGADLLCDLWSGKATIRVEFVGALGARHYHGKTVISSVALPP